MDYRPLAGISAAAVLVLLGGFTARAEDDHGNGSRVCLEETENALLVEVPAPMTSFEVPASWLEPGVKHQVVVGVRTPSGNITNVESAFFTTAE